MRRLVFAALLSLCSIALVVPHTAAQTPLPRPLAKAPVDSTSRICMDIGWLDRASSCEGRVLNTLGMTLIGGIAGMADGAVGGLVIPTNCIGNYEKAAVRGAIAGAALGTVVSLAVPYISRREAAAKNARDRERALAHPTKPWSFQDLKPVLVITGLTAATGAAIGATQGARHPSPCSGGIGGGAATGAAVYGGGFVAGTGALLLGVRLLF